MHLGCVSLSSAFLRYSCCKSAFLLSEHAISNLVISFRSRFTSLSTISTFAMFSFLRLSICLRDLWSFYWIPERLLDYYDSVSLSHTFSFMRAITRRDVSQCFSGIRLVFFWAWAAPESQVCHLPWDTGMLQAGLSPDFVTAFSDCTFGREVSCWYANSIVLAVPFGDLHLP